MTSPAAAPGETKDWRCMIGLHRWVPETHGSYIYCARCRKYNIWQSSKPAP